MPKLLRSFAISLLLLAAVSLMAQQPAPPNPWKTYKSKIGNFTALLPGDPKISIQNQDTAPTYTSSCELGDAAFFVSYTLVKNSVPREKAEVVLDGAEGGLFSAFKGKIATKQKLTFQGLPARRLRFVVESDGQDMAGETLLIFAGDGLYQVMVLAATPPGPDQDDAAKFFSSFSLDGVKYKEPAESDNKPATPPPPK